MKKNFHTFLLFGLLFVLLFGKLHFLKKSFFILFSFFLIKAPIRNESADQLRLDDVVIYSVSTDIKRDNYKPRGSIEGGTFVYIKASGID